MAGYNKFNFFVENGYSAGGRTARGIEFDFANQYLFWPNAGPIEFDFANQYLFWPNAGDNSIQFDFSHQFYFWHDPMAITYTSHRLDGDMVCSIDTAFFRPLSAKEVSVSDGAYTERDGHFSIPTALLPPGVLPKPGDVVTDQFGTDWTVLSVAPGKVDRTRQPQTQTVIVRDLAIAYDLSDAVDLQAPFLDTDAAGGKVQRWPDDGSYGSTPYKSLRARVQEVTEDMADERAIRGLKGTYAIYLPKQVSVSYEWRVKWIQGQTIRYFSILGLRNPQRIDELPVLDCTLAP